MTMKVQNKTQEMKEKTFKDCMGRQFQRGALIALAHKDTGEMSVGMLHSFTDFGVRLIPLTKARYYHDSSHKETRTSKSWFDPQNDEVYEPDTNYMDVSWEDDGTENRHGWPRRCIRERMIVLPENTLSDKLKKEYNYVLNKYNLQKPQ